MLSAPEHLADGQLALLETDRGGKGQGEMIEMVWVNCTSPRPTRCRNRARSVLVLGMKLRDLRVDLFHVEALHGIDDLLQSGAWQRASLVEDQNAFPEGHQGRNAFDVECCREPLIRLGVKLRESDVPVLLRSLLIDRSESLTGSTPVSPEVDQHDVVLGDGVLEVVGGDVDRRHRCCSSGGGRSDGLRCAQPAVTFPYS